MSPMRSMSRFHAGSIVAAALAFGAPVASACDGSPRSFLLRANPPTDAMADEVILEVDRSQPIAHGTPTDSWMTILPVKRVLAGHYDESVVRIDERDGTMCDAFYWKSDDRFLVGTLRLSEGGVALVVPRRQKPPEGFKEEDYSGGKEANDAGAQN